MTSNWNINQVIEWLKTLSISEEITKSFSDNCIDGASLLLLTADELKNDLG